MQGIECRGSFPFGPLLVCAEQGTCRLFHSPPEGETVAFPPVAERLKLRQDVFSLEHWLDLNA